MNNRSAYLNKMKFNKSLLYNIDENLNSNDMYKNSNNYNLDIDDLIFFDEEWHLSEK